MKILQTPVRLFSTGGVESYVSNLSRELAEMGHDVRIVCADSAGQREMSGSFSIKTLWTAGMIANTNITPALPLTLLKEDFDIVHAHLPTPWSADWSAMTARLKGRPLVLTYHSDIMGRGLAGHVARAYNRTALWPLLKAADRIIVARSRFISHYLTGFQDKIETIPMGVNIEALRPLPGARIGDIFFLSVLDEFHDFKGLDVLLRSIKIVKRQLPQVRLVVGGSGTLLDRYRHIASAMGVADNVDFVGHISAGQLADYYNGCGLFVLPSTDPQRETFGIVLIEALACGRPVVATEIAGAADDIAEMGAGIIVKPDDDAALAKAIISILENEDLASRMGRTGRRLAVERYSWKSVARRTERVYRELM
ncbi:MAG: putative glycosyl transferase [Methanosaeta sp. PtaU1.Bin028]|nr:MAG: putative glycosyl transferase [Methanosaeta sp. PtaU1.Bin028]